VLAAPGMPGSASTLANRVDTLGHRRHCTPVERLELVRSFESGRFSREEFCAANGLSLCTLGKWLKRYREQGEAGLADKPNPRNTNGRSRGWYSPEERRAALEAFGGSGLAQREFARVWGVALKTLSVWLKRHGEGGPKALESKKRGRPPGSGGKPILAAPVRERIVATKERFPTFGLRKVRDFLVRFHGLRVSTGGVRSALRAEGIAPTAVPKKRRLSREEPRSFERSRPGELWQSDITSFVLTRHSQRVYLVVFLDDFSRYVVSFALHVQMRAATVSETLLEGIARFGKPKEVLTDQGPQYFTWRGKSAFQKLLVREGIRHVVARSHHPQTVGKCERLWETVSREFWERVQPQDLSDARARLAHFFAHYNHFRPHQGIGGLVPADRFFGAEAVLKKTIEEQISKNALQLALGEAPRTNAYVFMQVGEHQVSVHGEKGVVVVTMPDGTRREIRSEELGISLDAAKEEDRGDRDTGDAAGRGSAGEAASDADVPQEGPLQELATAGDRSAWSLELGERGGEEPRAPAVRDDAGAVAGPGEEGRGDGAAVCAGAAPVADVAVGALGYAGWASQTAEAEAEGRKEGGDGSAERSQEERETDPGAGEGERDSEEPRESPEGFAGQPGREDRS
jgi:transposase InsO family protein